MRACGRRDGVRRRLQLGGGLRGAVLRLLQRLLGEQVGRARGLGLDADPLELGLGGGDKTGDPADLGGRSGLLGLGGTELAVGGVGRRRRDGDRGSGGADEHGRGQDAGEQRPQRAARGGPAGAGAARGRRSGRTATTDICVAPWGRGWRGGR